MNSNVSFWRENQDCFTLHDFKVVRSTPLLTISLLRVPLRDASLFLLCQGLKENKTVTSLFLHDNNFGDQGVWMLAKTLPLSLTSLRINKNLVTDRGVEILSKKMLKTRSITHLDLEENCITSMEHLAQLDFLKSLDVSSNSISDQGARCIAKVLRRNQTRLYSFYICRNLISRKGLASLGKAITKNKTLKSFYFNNNLSLFFMSRYMAKNPFIINLSTLEKECEDFLKRNVEINLKGYKLCIFLFFTNQ
jgi:Ran GTPase-activating protein (RanGAP) involved in mRNA processing and transport